MTEVTIIKGNHTDSSKNYYTKAEIKKLIKKRKENKTKPMTDRTILKKQPTATVRIKAPAQVEFRSQSFKDTYNKEKGSLLSWK